VWQNCAEALKKAKLRGMTQIKSVSTRAERKLWIDYPYQKYRNHPTWVPPMLLQEWDDTDPKKNPFYDHSEIELFIALDNNKIVGRIAAILDKSFNQYRQENTVLFSNLEADTSAIFKQLLEQVENWARSRGADTVKGPSKIAQNDMHGFLVENFDDPPAIMMNYNPPEYIAWSESAGYIKYEDTFAWKMTVAQGLPERVGRIAERVKKNLRVTLRPLNFKQLNEEVAHIRKIYNSAWSRNLGFVPWTEDEIDHLKKQLSQVADQQISFMAEIDGNPVAFSLVLPDLNQALPGTGGKLLPFGIFKLQFFKYTRMRLVALGILDDYHGKGLDALLYAESFWRGQKKYASGEFGWTLESNDGINNGMKALGAIPYKRYRIFQKKL
jgi:GNAT superfamily N-acetyltransferase